jgi:hypothetical protein
MQVGDVVRVLVDGTWFSFDLEAIEPRRTWDGKDLGGWIDTVVLRLPSGRRLRFKRGIIEESGRFQIQARLAA